ncbi:MAG: hypothetical protein IJJ40_03205 [Clostridia bacterium]|nr:hypothetical protein [Clostridia bacterium]MBR3144450.1 hypothetical protein [Clostridia bacterium]
MKRRKRRHIIVVSSGIENSEFERIDEGHAMSEFDIQKTAESANLYPAIAQGYPVNGFKDAVKEDKFE